MRIRHHALGQQRDRHRRPGLLRQAPHLRRRPRQHRPVPRQHHRTPRLRQPFRHLPHLPVPVRPHRRPVSRQHHLRIQLRPAFLLRHVLRHVDEHRTRPPARRDVHRLLHHPRNVIRRLHQIAVLHDRHRQVEHVGFLERVLAEHRPRRLPRHDQQRDAVHVRRHDARHRVRRSRPARHEHRRRTPRRPRVPVRHVRRPLLVPRQHEPHLRPVRVQRIVQRQRRPPRNPERLVDSRRQQPPYQRLSPAHNILFYVQLISHFKKLLPFSSLKCKLKQSFTKTPATFSLNSPSRLSPPLLVPVWPGSPRAAQLPALLPFSPLPPLHLPPLRSLRSTPIFPA